MVTPAANDAARLAAALALLPSRDPAYSAHSIGGWRPFRWAAGVAAVVAAAVIAYPGVVAPWMLGAATALFAVQAMVRLFALHHALCLRPGCPSTHGASHRPGAAFPIYSVLVALRHERAIANQLVGALRALEYPTQALEIIFILEADDEDTRAALTAAGLDRHMQIVTVPDGAPRTKPRALCYGLTFARGDYVVVYDAEDRPEPDQLKRALAAFAAAGPRLGCLQARLNIYNATHSVMTRQFAIEYTALFDGVLPAVSHYQLPVPLGGTSNHFPRTALDDAGAWDPYNVTEDADLGFRLARRGWRVDVLPSTTWEEAPPRLRSWFSQRTRWQKGWMQTYLVHMRAPARLWRELGPRGFLWFQVVLGGGLASALAHPWFMLWVGWHAWWGTLWPHETPGHLALLPMIGVGTLVLAALSTLALGLVTLSRRGRGDLMWSALLQPLYWWPVSVAAHCALIELIRAPHHWAKTPHGEA